MHAVQQFRATTRHFVSMFKLIAHMRSETQSQPIHHLARLPARPASSSPDPWLREDFVRFAGILFAFTCSEDTVGNAAFDGPKYMHHRVTAFASIGK